MSIKAPCFFLFLWKMTFLNPPNQLKNGKFHTFFEGYPNLSLVFVGNTVIMLFGRGQKD